MMINNDFHDISKAVEVRYLPEVEKIEQEDFLVIEKTSGTRKVSVQKLDNIKTPIEHSLISTASYKALSAGMGKALNDKIDSIEKVQIIDNLTSIDKLSALSANQGSILKGMINEIPKVQVIDRLDSTATTHALSANQGNEIRKMLNDLIQTQAVKTDNPNTRSLDDVPTVGAVREMLKMYDVKQKNSGQDTQIDGLRLSKGQLMLIVNGQPHGPIIDLQFSNGNDGLSPYELAVKEGYRGTLRDWLISLHGKTGDNGKDGINGLSAYEIAVIHGFVGTEKEWLNSLKIDNSILLKDSVIEEESIFVKILEDGSIAECTEVVDALGVRIDSKRIKYNGQVDVRYRGKKPTIGKYVIPSIGGYAKANDNSGYRVIDINGDKCTILFK